MGEKAGIWTATALGALALLLLAVNIDVITGNWQRQEEIARRQGEINNGAAVTQFSRSLRAALRESASHDERVRDLLRSEPP